MNSRIFAYIKSAHQSDRWLIAFWTSLVTVGVFRTPWISGDTVALAQGANALVECARNGDFLGCPGTHQFGVIQNMPALFLSWKGFSEADLVTALGILNLIVFILASVIIYRLLRDLTYKNLFCIVLLAGPVAPYMQSTFGEMLQVVAYLGFGLSILKSKYSLTFLFAVLATSTRETSFFPLLLIGFACVFELVHNSRKELLQRLGFVLLSIMSGLILLALFNVWKFGTWKNIPHSDPVLIVRDFKTIASSFFGIWLGPGGGLFPFWIAASVIVFFLSLRNLYSDSSVRQKLVPLLTISALGASTFSLAIWYAPFGWVAWGPRLMLPIMALCLLVTWYGNQNQVSLLVTKINTKPLLKLLLVGIIGLSAAPSIGFQFKPSVLNEFIQPDKFCDRPAIIQEDSAYYLSCLRHGTWKTNASMWSSGLHGFNDLVPYLILILGFISIWSALGVRDRLDSENHNAS